MTILMIVLCSIVYLVCGGGAAGLMASDKPNDGEICGLFLIAALWPLFAAFGIVAGIGYGGYWCARKVSG